MSPAPGGLIILTAIDRDGGWPDWKCAIWMLALGLAVSMTFSGVYQGFIAVDAADLTASDESSRSSG